MADNAADRFIAGWTPVLLILLGLTALPLLLVFDRPHGSVLENVKRSGMLRVLTLNGPTTYYHGPNGPQGLEYELLEGFARGLGVELEVMLADSFASILPRLRRGDADVAAAGITVTKEREKLVRFSIPYQEIRQQVVYLRGSKRPREVEELVGRQLEVVAGSSFAERLRELRVEHPGLDWTETSEKGPEELLEEVTEELLELTIADSNLIAVSRQHLPQLGVAFDIQEPEKLAWAFPRDTDDSLSEAASDYLRSLEESGELARLLDRHYGAVRKFNYVNIATYRRRIASTLPAYRAWFEEAGSVSGIDWRLLAAQAYQESQWNPEAVSPTGVKGMMQLTNATAARLNINDRTDPHASILGGAEYLRRSIARVPERIEEPDRTWLGLAAYNIGFGHLEDARVLTQRNGGNPDRWTDVKKHLPLLAKQKWHQQTKHGYARGYEAVSYVTRIRLFYDILRRIDEQEKAGAPRGTPTLDIQAPAI